jgi:thiol-disulfide isomerase/thioredoxin
MKKLLIFIGIIAVAIVAWQGFTNLKTSEISGLAEPQKAPDFNLRDYKGKPVTLSDFVGKSLVINSWAAWCPFCVQELPDFAIAQKEFGDKITIIAINRAESLKVAREYTDNLGVTDQLIFLLDPEDSFYRSIGGFSMPETIFVDKNGNIIQHKRGPLNLEEIRERIKNLVISN